MTPPRDENGTAPRDVKRDAGVTRDLAARIAAAKRGQMGPAEADGRSSGQMSALGRGFRIGSEFAAAILVGAALGYLLDLWLGTQPWIMLVMLLFGFAAGILNVTRAVAEMNKAAQPQDGADLGRPNDEQR
ncbi:ATP synthase protein I [Devosia enhydra]|uniref:ATP synthase protein I n=1 Tax=Devosia enhydra TaxID=665118 RepID=A0A1K2I143_9HYPH|nr:ATP synthase protein I [Devosia enhydra]